MNGISHSHHTVNRLILLLILIFQGSVWAQEKVRTGGVAQARAEMLKRGELAEVVVYLAPDADPEALARENGLSVKRRLPGNSNAVILETVSPDKAKNAKMQLAKDKRVRTVYQNRITQKKLYAFSPNDPYFHNDTPSAGHKGQWHLINELGTGIDVRVQTPWQNDVTGQGVLIGIVDDGLESAHEDLSANFNGANSHDYIDGDSNPSPTESGDTDSHGTAVGGTAGARGANSIGVTGAAPYASLAGLRMGFGTPASSTDADFADATSYHSSGNNTAIKIKNHSYGYSYPWISVPIEIDALHTSAAAGTIHCYAAGNERSDGLGAEDVNKHPYQSQPDMLPIGAIDSAGKFSYYSNYGANLAAVAPSGLLTTDPMGVTRGFNTGGSGSFPNTNYVAGIEGTSFSSPLAAGVIALVKQVQPALNIRFIKHLLARNSDIVDPNDSTAESDGGWKTNAAGIKFNQNYGWGLINATKLVQAAPQYSGVTPLQTADSGLQTVNLNIPDNDNTGVTATCSLNGSIPLEEVLVTLNITHPYLGDIEAYLTSPAGTTSRLFDAGGFSDNTSNLVNWTVCSNVFWGENPQGTWTLRVNDLSPEDTGALNSFRLKVNLGQLVDNQSIWVDFAWNGDETGAVEQPFNTLAEAIAAAPEDGMIVIKGDTPLTHTLEKPRIQKRLRIDSNNGPVSIGN